jgi:hypothetical protein
MKKTFRNLLFLTLLAFATLFTGSSRGTSAAPTQQVPDPPCVTECSFLLSQCLGGDGTKNSDRACMAVYRHCIAQCGKHEWS